MSLEKINSIFNKILQSSNVPNATINTVLENQNIFEGNQTSYDVHNQTWDDDWEEVPFKSDKFCGFLWWTGTYTYQTHNGSKITVKNTDGIAVIQNKLTNEIVVIGAKAENINLSQGDNITLIETSANEINAQDGDATIKIEGSNSSVTNVNGGKGSQSVIVSAGAKVDHIKTGDDDDVVIVSNAEVGKVETGKGDDGLIAYNSKIKGNANLESGNNYWLEESDEKENSQQESFELLLSMMRKDPENASGCLISYCGSQEKAIELLNQHLSTLDDPDYTYSAEYSDRSRDIVIKKVPTDINNSFTSENTLSITWFFAPEGSAMLETDDWNIDKEDIFSKNEFLMNYNKAQEDVVFNMHSDSIILSDDIYANNTAYIESLREAKTFEDLINITSLFAGSDKKLAQSILNAIFSDKTFITAIGGNQLSINEEGHIVVNGVEYININSIPEEISKLFPKNQKDIYINSIMDYRNGDYVLNDSVLKAASDERTEYFISSDGNITCVKSQYSFDAEGNKSSAIHTCFDLKTGEVKYYDNEIYINTDGQTYIASVRTDKNGNIIKQDGVGEVLSKDEYIAKLKLETTARKYTDRIDLSYEELQKFSAIDYLVNSNSQLQEMFIHQDFNEGIITDAHGKRTGKEEEAKSIIQKNNENNLRLIAALNGESGEKFEDVFKEIYGVEYNQTLINSVMYYENAITFYSSGIAQIQCNELLLQQAYDNNDIDAIKLFFDTFYSDDEELAQKLYSEYIEYQNNNAQKRLEEDRLLIKLQCLEKVVQYGGLTQELQDEIKKEGGQDAWDEFLDIVGDDVSNIPYPDNFYYDGEKTVGEQYQEALKDYYWNLFIQSYGDTEEAQTKFEQFYANGTYNISYIQREQSTYAKYAQEQLNKAYTNLGIDPEYMVEDYETLTEFALGNQYKEDMKVVSDYITSQQGFNNIINTYVFGLSRTAGTVLMIGGAIASLIPGLQGGGALAIKISSGLIKISSGLIKIGSGLASFGIYGSDAYNIVESSTKHNYSPEEVSKNLTNTAVHIAMREVGRIVSPLSNSVGYRVSDLAFDHGATAAAGVFAGTAAKGLVDTAAACGTYKLMTGENMPGLSALLSYAIGSCTNLPNFVNHYGLNGMSMHEFLTYRQIGKVEANGTNIRVFGNTVASTNPETQQTQYIPHANYGTKEVITRIGVYKDNPYIVTNKYKGAWLNIHVAGKSYQIGFVPNQSTLGCDVALVDPSTNKLVSINPITPNNAANTQTQTSGGLQDTPILNNVSPSIMNLPAGTANLYPGTEVAAITESGVPRTNTSPNGPQLPDYFSTWVVNTAAIMQQDPHITAPNSSALTSSPEPAVSGAAAVVTVPAINETTEVAAIAESSVPETLQDNFVQEQLDYFKDYYGEESDQYEHAKQLLSNEKLVELIRNKKIDMRSIKTLAGSKESDFARLQDILSDDNVIRLLEKGYDISDIRSFSKNLPDDSLANFHKVISNSRIAELLLSKQILYFEFKNFIANYSDEVFGNLQALLSNDNLFELIGKKVKNGREIKFAEVKDLSELGSKEFERAQTLLSNDKITDLIKNGIISLYNIETYSKLEDRLFEQMQTLLLNDNVLTLLKKNSDLLYCLDTISKMPQDEFKNALKILSNDEFAKLVSNKKDHLEAFSILAKILDLSKLDGSAVDNLLNNLNKLASIYGDSYEIDINILQISNEVILTATKTIESSDNPEGLKEHITPEEYSEYVMVTKTVTMNPDGTLSQSTTYRDNAGNEESWLEGSDRVLIIGKKTGEKYTHEYYTSKYRELATANLPVQDINYQIEIINNEQGEPSYILYTKESPELTGAYETIRYDLKDYPEDMDVLSAIKNGTIDGGKKLSTVTKDGAQTRYQESYERNGYTINRDYTQQVDEQDQLSSYEYSYNIEDGNGNSLLSLNRSWSKNQDGTTTTVINGRTYTASFDDDKLEVRLTLDDGTTRVINIKDKLASFAEYDEETNIDKEYAVNKYKTEEALQKAFFEFVKTLPADQLITIDNHVSKIFITEAISSAMGREAGKLNIGLNAAILSHEMGHGIDFEGADMPESGKLITTGKISSDPELRNIYNQEMEQFTREYPEEAQNIIAYFTRMGGGNMFGINTNAGLSELVAETNMLITTYGISEEMVQTRSEYLVRYFPKTVARIGELLLANRADEITAAPKTKTETGTQPDSSRSSEGLLLRIDGDDHGKPIQQDEQDLIGVLGDYDYQKYDIKQGSDDYNKILKTMRQYELCPEDAIDAVVQLKGNSELIELAVHIHSQYNDAVSIFQIAKLINAGTSEDDINILLDLVIEEINYNDYLYDIIDNKNAIVSIIKLKKEKSLRYESFQGIYDIAKKINFDTAKIDELIALTEKVDNECFGAQEALDFIDQDYSVDEIIQAVSMYESDMDTLSGCEIKQIADAIREHGVQKLQKIIDFAAENNLKLNSELISETANNGFDFIQKAIDFATKYNIPLEEGIKYIKKSSAQHETIEPRALTIDELIKKYESGTPWEDIVDDKYAQIRRTREYAVNYGENNYSGDYGELYNAINETQKGIFPIHAKGWILHTTKLSITGLAESRMSLNVKGDADLIKTLDEIILESDGAFEYKMPESPSEWGDREDPITLYFPQEPSSELIEKIIEATRPYQRGVIDGAENDTPWLVFEKYITESQVDELLARAKALNEDLYKTLYEEKGEDKNMSTGFYKACSQIMDEYETYLRLKDAPQEVDEAEVGLKLAVQFEADKDFCEKIIDEYTESDFTLPSGTKLKIKDRITDPNELMQALEAMKTPYDTQKIVEQRAKSLVAGRLNISNCHASSLKKDPAISGILADAIESISTSTKGKELYVIAGNTASGKSTYCTNNSLNAKNGYFVIDSDDIKTLLPGYEEFGANFTHGISASIARAELEIAIEQGVNIVYPTTGTAQKIIELAKNAGYNVRMIYCDLPTEQCISRAMNRFLKNRRFVDPYYILNNGNTIEKIKNVAENYGIIFIIKK